MQVFHEMIATMLLACMLAAPVARAAEPNAPGTYPNRAVTLVEPFSTQVEFGKSLSLSASKFLNQKVILEPRQGAAGAIGAASVRSAPADGYTLLLGRPASQFIRPAMVPETPYRWNDFTVLGILEIDPLICAVRNDSPYASVRALLEAIRKNPGTLKYASLGVATNTHLGVQYMLHLAGMKHDAAAGVTFASSQEAIDALVTGKVQFLLTAGGLIEPIKTGQLRGLFSTAPGRLAALPQLPNASEVGLRDMGRIVGWTALVGPRDLPAEVVARWRDVLNKVSRDPEWLAANERVGGLPVIRTLTDADQFMRDQFALYDQLITTLDLAR